MKASKNPPVEHGNSGADNLQRERFFKHCERAPYEIAHLLRQLPPDTSRLTPQTEETRAIAYAVHRHACNGLDNALCSIEVLGKLLVKIGCNAQDNTLDAGQTVDVGALFQSLAVQAQMYYELSYDMGGIAKGGEA
jgi:hypothetical protein